MSIKDLDPAVPGSDSNAGLGDDELRSLKTALQACFPALEAAITNAGGTGDADDANPPNAATFSKLFDDVRALESGLGGAATVPIGLIAMWGGAEGTIPAGWALCDGTNGTPNLADRFIVGADYLAGPGQFDIGNTGGNNWISGGTNGKLSTEQSGSGTATGTISIPDHVLTENNLPEHDHFVAVDTAGTTPNVGDAVAGKPINSHDAGGDAEYRLKQSSSAEANVGLTSKYGATGAPDPLTHPDQDIEITGIVHSHNYSPRYYALAFIQYIGA